MERTPLVAGNWKMFKTVAETVRHVKSLRALVKDITDAVVRNCKVDKDAVTVIIHENPRTDKAKGGVLFSER